MSESEYYAKEFTDLGIDRLADAGDYYLDEQGFQYRLTKDEIEVLMAQGRFYIDTGALFIDNETQK